MDMIFLALVSVSVSHTVTLKQSGSDGWTGSAFCAAERMHESEDSIQMIDSPRSRREVLNVDVRQFVATTSCLLLCRTQNHIP